MTRRPVRGRRPLLVLYPETPARRAGRLVADLLMPTWIIAWAWLALRLYQQVTRLAAIGRTIQDTGLSIADNIAAVQDKFHDVPFVGDRTAPSLERAGTAAQSLASAGHAEQQLAGDLALALAVLLLIGPTALLLLRWLPRRIRWITRATSAARLRDGPGGTELLALRALTNRSLHELTRTNPDPAAAWRDRRPAELQALAALELRRYGLRATAR